MWALKPAEIWTFVAYFQKEHKTAAPARMESYDEFIKRKRVEEGEGENTDNTDSDEAEEPKVHVIEMNVI